MRNINWIIIHCSDSEWGDFYAIDKWHKDRGWKGCGYHYVIGNGYQTYEDYKNKRRMDSGFLQKGRADSEIGAHVLGMNSDSIGIVLIGRYDFTKNQFSVLANLCCNLMDTYGLPVENILGHYECPTGKSQGKTCPNFEMKFFRIRLKLYCHYKKLMKKLGRAFPPFIPINH